MNRRWPSAKTMSKGQGGFARTGDAGDDGELAMRDAQGKIFEIIFPGAGNLEAMVVRTEWVGGAGFGDGQSFT